MKAKIIYIAAYLIAFLVTTGGMIFLNSQFNNIFEFDFSPPQNFNADSLKQQLMVSDSVNVVNPETPVVSIEKNPETKTVMTAEKMKLLDSIDVLRAELEEIKKNNLDNVNTTVQNTTQNTSEENNNDYQKWLKKTADLYSSMDSRKAAKIIQNYSDNIARDIIYAMKKKKAADILAEMNPETATRIMKIN